MATYLALQVKNCDQRRRHRDLVTADRFKESLLCETCCTLFSRLSNFLSRRRGKCAECDDSK